MSAKTVNEEAAQTVSPRQWIRLVVVYLLIPLILRDVQLFNRR
jgi:hypothetical protein